MSADLVRKIADAVLYEGYMLYPYRSSSAKNRQRWTFGGVYPAAYASANGEPSSVRCEVLVEPDRGLLIEATVRFLHIVDRQGFQEAMEREVRVNTLDIEQRFRFPAWRRNDEGVERRQEAMEGRARVAVSRVEDGLFKVGVEISNATPFDTAQRVSREEASMYALVSTHVILHATNGRFMSATDAKASAECRNSGLWPVLAGTPGDRGWMLASPIILYDYPEIAPESPGDLFDGTEIDEILTLRILTMTDAEKAEARASDERTRRLLDRTEGLTPDQLMQLHGALRSPRMAGGGE